MFLNIFTDLKQLISDILAEFSWTDLFILFTGIIIGFIICAIAYLVIVLLSVKKNEIKIKKAGIDISDEDIKRVIRSSHNEFYESAANAPVNQKMKDLKDISWELINSIAKMYYPKSDYPIYELSIDEMMMLTHYITNRVDSLFKGKILKSFKKVRISQILKLLEMKRKIDESKVVKAANKAKLPSIYKATMSVLNVFNPAYWVKKLMINTTISIGTNKIAATIIDIIGEETTKVYSKSVFNEEKVLESDVENTIKALEAGLENNDEVK